MLMMFCIFQDLQEDHAGVPLKVSEPVVGYRETVTAESSIVALSKSQNKHNRIYAKAAPLGDALTLAIEAGQVSAHDDDKLRARVLADEFGWDITDARKIWCFGPDTTGANVLVDDDPEAIVAAAESARFPAAAPPLYGDGHAADRIAAALRRL